MNNIPKEEANISLDNGNYKLDVYTDFDSVHVYTAGFTEHEMLITDENDDIYKGLTLECSSLAPEFKKAKEHYTYHVKYVFRRKSDEN